MGYIIAWKKSTHSPLLQTFLLKDLYRKNACLLVLVDKFLKEIMENYPFVFQIGKKFRIGWMAL